MKRSFLRIAFAIMSLLAASVLWDLLSTEEVETGKRPNLAGPRAVRNVRAAYWGWRAAFDPVAAERVVLALGWVKGLSLEPSRGSGKATIDLKKGVVALEVGGLSKGERLEAWLVDNRPGPGRSVKPEPGDTMVRLGSLGDGESSLRAVLPPGFLESFELDLVVLTRTGESPAQGGILFGAPTLFQRLEAGPGPGRKRAERSASLRGAGEQGTKVLLSLTPALVHAQEGDALAVLDPLVAQGQELFFNETFSGNGRTCGTCHPAKNNLTIDPKFIATLPKFDPLFVAEFVPALAVNFEKPALMREMGLILENLDGFGDLANRFVMRGVPHTLGLATSLTAASGADGTTVPPNQRTGWSGDGAPGGGTLRDFAIGAVTQHFTRTLGRVPGLDFRLPTDEELDALEAFQLSLGRGQDLNLGELRLRNAFARRGQELFLAADTASGTRAAGKCNLCHANAGATFSGAPGGLNFNFNTGVEAQPDKRANLILPGQRRPDGGFGTAPNPSVPGAFGNGTFNTPPLVEAADTFPFFHDNEVRSLEEAVAFYDSQTFNDSPSGRFLASTDSGQIGIRLEPTQVGAIAAFLRVINSLENIRSAIELQREVQSGDRDAAEGLGRSLDELEDAIAVLKEIDLHEDAVKSLRAAIFSTQFARSASDPAFRSLLLDTAIASEEQARSAMAR